MLCNSCFDNIPIIWIPFASASKWFLGNVKRPRFTMHILYVGKSTHDVITTNNLVPLLYTIFTGITKETGVPSREKTLKQRRDQLQELQTQMKVF